MFGRLSALLKRHGMLIILLTGLAITASGLLVATLGVGLALFGDTAAGPVPTFPASPTRPPTATAQPTPVAMIAIATATQPLPSLPPAFAATALPTSSAPETAPDEVAEALPGCQTPPEGWVLHRVEPGETLFAYVLGANSQGESITTNDVRSVNCLTSDLLQVGQALYLPKDAAEYAPPSEPYVAPGSSGSGPRTPNCNPHCTISIRPGWRAEQIAAAIDSIDAGFWGADLLAAIRPGASLPSYGFLGSKPGGNTLEGFLYPGTYQITNDTTAADFREMLLAAFAANLPGNADALAASHGLSLYQAITLASIIQRESWAASEQVLISSVLHNRLRTGMPLAATVTTQYALGAPGNWWPRVRGNMINTASPYNTNRNGGLPPSPISNPNAQAISAALSPANTDYIFFTGNCRGSGNVYAATYDQHLANVNACR